MKFSIVFNKSGDSLEFDTLDSTKAQILDYYVDNLNQKNSNSFRNMIDPGFIDRLISNLHSSITESNRFIKLLTDQSVDEFKHEEYMNQPVLNQLHADWVNSHVYRYNIQEKRRSVDSKVSAIADQLHELFSDDIKTIDLGTVLTKLGHDHVYGEINENIHKLESAFNNFRFGTTELVQFENIFPKSLLDNDICNFRIPFQHLGRTLYHKYQYFDDKLEYADENSFNELLGYVEVNLGRSHTVPLSQEYIAWCQRHGKDPSGIYLNIGNLANLEKRVNDYRLVVYRNIRSCNSFSIKLNKG